MQDRFRDTLKKPANLLVAVVLFLNIVGILGMGYSLSKISATQQTHATELSQIQRIGDEIETLLTKGSPLGQENHSILVQLCQSVPQSCTVPHITSTHK